VSRELDAEGELVRDELAQHDRARALKPRHAGRVLVGNPVREQRRAARGEDAARRVDVLVAERDAQQRTRDIAAAERGLGSLGVGQRPIGGHGHERVELGIELLDPLEVRARQLDRRDRAAPETRADVANRRVEELLTGHDRLASARYRT
jgi:hypothetical protein